jgi:hypothetical protein
MLDEKQAAAGIRITVYRTGTAVSMRHFRFGSVGQVQRAGGRSALEGTDPLVRSR